MPDHERIYLQCEETSAEVSCNGRTWAETRVDEGCTEYVRADLYAALKARVEELEAENADLERWLDDLHSDMFINCVYCAHRYGPRDETAATIPEAGERVSMADALRLHIEQCPKHPMSALQASIAQLTRERDALAEAHANCDPEGPLPPTERQRFEAKVQFLEEANDALAEDKARLDWLLRQKVDLGFGGDGSIKIRVTFTHSVEAHNGGLTLREAIDNARKEAPE